MTPPARDFPFTAVVGQDDARLALVLAALDPTIGGVLLRGDKGSAKSTLARGLAKVLPRHAPFVELPIGATEDRVVGTLDLRAALTGGETRLHPGLLAAAHGGVLYVDEVNLLPDHLVDVLLDVAVSGVNRVERDGVSHDHPSRFVLVGSMNPEEGELRPQLLDRFGLAVDVSAPADPALRATVVRRRIAHDAGNAVADSDAAMSRRLAGARRAALTDDVVDFACRLAVAVGAEGLRADLVLCRAAAALAGWEGRDRAEDGDVERVAPLALGHRRRRRPFEPPVLPPDELAAALDAARGPQARGQLGEDPEGVRGDAAPAPADGRDQEAGQTTAGRDRPGAPPHDDISLGAERPVDPPPGLATGGTPTGRWRDLAGESLSATPASPAALLPDPHGPSSGRPTAVDPGARRRSAVTGASVPDGRGRVVGDRRPGADGPTSIAVAASVRAAAQRRAADPTGPELEVADLREPRPARPIGRTVIVAVDTSGSMGTPRRIEAATGAVLGLLADAYLRRDRVAVVTFRADDAVVALPPTGSVELARARLADLPTGGATPLAEGIAAALDVAHRAAAEGSPPVLVLLTDGRATSGTGALDRAQAAAADVATAGIGAVVIDAEDGPTRLGLAADVAHLMGAQHVRLADLSATDVEAAVRDALRE